MWKAVKIESVECESELCIVQLKLTYDIPRGKMSPQSVKGIETPVSRALGHRGRLGVVRFSYEARLLRVLYSFRREVARAARI